MSETRKLAAILCADVVGYSRLSGVDEEGTTRRLRALRAEVFDPAIETYRGRVFHTAGDSILVEFASVVDAARCALEVQRRIEASNADFVPEKRMEFRMGIHLGDVIALPDGDLLGDGVNIAARLEGIAAPGGVYLSEDAYRQVRDKLKEGFVDLGENNLKNIARPVRVYALAVGDIGRANALTPAQPTAPKKRSTLAPLAAGIAAFVILIAAGAWWFLSANRPATTASNALAPVASSPAAPAEAKHLSIVVLPFTNLSGDPSQDYFADGVTENLSTDLSRIRNSFVIAHSTAVTFKGKNLDAKEIGKELGVRYVLEGSAQRDQNRVRVNAQLVDAESGAQLWADRFEEDVADLFKLQDQVVARLVNSLGNELVKAEAEKAPVPKTPTRSISPCAAGSWCRNCSRNVG